MTRSPAQESECKDLGRNDQDRVITPKATHTPTPNRAGSRLPLFPSCVTINSSAFSN
ncbi:IMP cyclohydrolase [Lacticaseibacillus rhamnosus]|nr:IMP cyclohydrolase [Lacticaseibacillus rhamnosus]MCT3191504.1 IMP cyclohydrolase [Lacticaseibacillus rhamnosus]MCT3371328.1 IMP cyclohydrolase [Lacticaseibacillus rhamnosus]TLQ25018.1 IMP cyclohydrolase [Lacticaseibacillus rhamnosus]